MASATSGTSGANVSVAPSGALTNSLLSQAQSIAAFAYSRAAVVDGFVNDLSTAVLGLQAPTISPEFPVGGSAPAVQIPDAPTFAAPVWISPAIPTAFTELLETADLEVEPFDDNPPAIFYASPPEAFSETLPDAPGVNLTFDDPTLTVTLPAVPDFLALSVTPFSGLNMPTFAASEPTIDLVAPSIREYTPGSQYTSSLLETTKAALEARIRDGGTGLTAEVENAIWDRGREREARTQAEALMRLDEMEELGYALPPGIYLDARTKLITEGSYADRGISREVMIKSAELELDQVKHALTTAVQLEGQLLDYTNAVEQRLFDSTRYATEAGIQIYNARVQAFGAMVDMYRAKVAVYEAQVRAEVSKVEAYRAQIAAEEAKAQINRALVDRYKVQVDAALSNIEIYKAQIAGIQTKAEIEKMKVMVFGEQVRAYGAKVTAYTAGIEAYRAQLSAEQTKQQVYQSQVEAFTARVNAASRQIEARISAYKGRIDAKVAEYESYKSQVQGEASRVQALAQVSGVVADVYKAQVTGAVGFNEVLTKQWQATLDQNQRTAEIAINAAKANAELYITTRSLALDAAKTGAQVSAQIGAAAINAVNVTGSVSSSESYSGSASVSVANSSSNVNSSSNSTSTSTNYNYSV